MAVPLVDPESKIMSFTRIKECVSEWHSKRDCVVFTNGCFDILHIGHVTLLDAARREGDRLIVGINSDESVARLKGSSRPVVPEYPRARVLASLAAVDAVVIFSDPTPLDLMIHLRPDVIVKGGDYVADEIVGASEVSSWGGRVKIVPFVSGMSTTQIIARASISKSRKS